jgi:hypothetical protein
MCGLDPRIHRKLPVKLAGRTTQCSDTRPRISLTLTGLRLLAALRLSSFRAERGNCAHALFAGIYFALVAFSAGTGGLIIIRLYAVEALTDTRAPRNRVSQLAIHGPQPKD